MGISSVGDRFRELVEANWQFYIDLAEGAFYLGDLEQAAWVMHKACAEAETFGGADLRLPAGLNRLGVLYFYMGRIREAQPLVQRAIALVQRRAPDDPAIGYYLYNLGGILKAQGNYVEAECMLKEAMLAWDRTLGPDHPDMCLALIRLGEMCMHLGRAPEALWALRRALSILDAQEIEDWRTLVVVTKLSVYYTIQDRLTEAEPFLWRAIQLRRMVSGLEQPKVAADLVKLGRIYRKQRKFARAEPLYRLSLYIEERTLGRRHPDFLGTLDELAELYHAGGKYTDAEPLFKLSLTAFEQALGEEHPHVADRLEHYASILRTLRRNEEAELFEARAQTIRAQRAAAAG